eukprot:8380484-Pyramimonas_sp.AAC.1
MCTLSHHLGNARTPRAHLSMVADKDCGAASMLPAVTRHTAGPLIHTSEWANRVGCPSLGVAARLVCAKRQGCASRSVKTRSHSNLLHRIITLSHENLRCY